jgi:aspartate/methionine/tyrosine aminotransferase
VNSPHNPTGKIFSKCNLKQLINYACRYNIYILFDEAYYNIQFDNDDKEVELSCLSNQVLIFRSFSKYFLLPGLRLGYLIGMPDIIKKISTVHHQMLGCLSKITEQIGQHILSSDYSIFDRKVCEYKEVACYAEAIFKKNNYLTLIRPQGTFYLFAQLNCDLDANAFYWELAERYRTLVLPGNIFCRNLPQYFRFAMVMSKEENLEGLERIINCIEYLL